MRFTLHTYQIFVVAGVLLVMVASSVGAADTPVVVTYTPETLVVHDTAPAVTATAFAIFDATTGRLLATQNKDLVLPIASVTKLLTAATVLRTVDHTDTYTITEADTAAHGRAGRLEVGEVYTAHELLFPLLLESSNDAAALFERVTEGDIIRRMNGYAKELGASTLAVADASGLSDRNVASVNDLAKLTAALYDTEPRVFDMTKLSKRTGPYTGWTNNSPVRNKQYVGGKHGFTEAAGRTVTAVYTETFSAGEWPIGYVLLGSTDLVADLETLRDFVATHVTLE
jgi:D-alanyl-D-alanine carboxypeptidase